MTQNIDENPNKKNHFKKEAIIGLYESLQKNNNQKKIKFLLKINSYNN